MSLPPSYEELVPKKHPVRVVNEVIERIDIRALERLRRVQDFAGIEDLRIHDFRHFATTMLFMEGVADAIIRKMAGQRADELERYKHFYPSFKEQTTHLIAGKLEEELKGTFLGTNPENEKKSP